MLAQQTVITPDRRRVLVTFGAILAGLIFLMLIITNRHMAVSGLRAASHAEPLWVAVTLGAALGSFVVTAAGVVRCTRGQVSLPASTVVEFAGAFCNRITPAGLGRGLLRIRYLRCAGLGCAEVCALTVMMTVAGGVVHALGIAASSVAANGGSLSLPGQMLSAPQTGPVAMIALIAVATGVLAVARLPLVVALRLLVIGWCAEVIEQCRRVVRDRRVLTGLMLGTLGSSGLYLVAFVAALRSAGIGLSVASAAFVYFAATAVANAAPVPGGLGAVELTLVTALVTAGTERVPAVAAVLVFRLASFWLPSILGGFALVWLRRRGLLSSSPVQGVGQGRHTPAVSTSGNVPLSVVPSA